MVLVYFTGWFSGARAALGEGFLGQFGGGDMFGMGLSQTV